MSTTGAWRAELRHIYDEQFDYEWTAHIADLNRRHRFEDRHRLATAARGMPPVWFNGNIEALKPERWVLVISLNPSLAREGQYDHVRAREAWWRLWLTYNRDHYYPTFFDPIVRVAATALGENVPRAAYPHFATDRMLFIELCPYASREFRMGKATLAQLVRSDRGFQVAARPLCQRS